MQIPSLAQALRIRDDINNMKTQLTDLQRQLVTGKQADTFGKLGTDRNLVLSLRSQIGSLDGYLATITQTDLRVKVMSDTLTRVSDIASEIKTSALTSGFELISGTQTELQKTSALRFDELVALLNTDVEDRYLFAGRDTQNPPVQVPDLILNGDTTRAGLIQVISERRQADLGTDGRGRLDVPAAVGPAVTISEEASPNAFGFKLTGATSSLTGTVVAGPAGAPASLSVTFSATLPNANEEISIDLTLPDGTVETITLKATATTPVAEGEFLIGADENATATNFQAALDAAVLKKAATALRSASAVVATDNFFDYDSTSQTQRVDGPPFDTATALIDATTANTVYWYTGDTDVSAASKQAIAKIDEGRLVSYGARADETAIRTVLKSAAVLAAESYTGADPNEKDAYNELLERVVPAIGFKGTQSVADIVTELGLVAYQLNETRDWHDRTISLGKGLVEDKENADSYEIGARLGLLQTQLQASFQVTARLNELTLINFIR